MFGLFSVYVFLAVVGGWLLVATLVALRRQFRDSRNTDEIRVVLVEKMKFPEFRPATREIERLDSVGRTLDQLIDEEFERVERALRVTRELSANAGLIAAPSMRLRSRSLEHGLMSAFEQVVSLGTEETIPGVRRLVTAFPEYIAWWVFPSFIVRITVEKAESDDWIAKVRCRPSVRRLAARMETEKVEELIELPARIAESVAALYDRLHPNGSGLLTSNERVRLTLFDFIRDVQRTQGSGAGGLIEHVAEHLERIASLGLSDRDRCVASLSLLQLLSEVRRGREIELFCVNELERLKSEVENRIVEIKPKLASPPVDDLRMVAISIRTRLAHSCAQLVHRYGHKPQVYQPMAVEHADKAMQHFGRFDAEVDSVEQIRLRIHALSMLPLALHCSDDIGEEYDEISGLYDKIILEYQSVAPDLLYTVYNNSAWLSIVRAADILRHDSNNDRDAALQLLVQAEDRLVAAHENQGRYLGELHRSNLGIVYFLRGRFLPSDDVESNEPEMPGSAAGWAMSAIKQKSDYLEARFELWLALACGGDDSATETLEAAIKQVHREAKVRVLKDDSKEDRIARRLSLHLKRSCHRVVAAGVLENCDVQAAEQIAQLSGSTSEQVAKLLRDLDTQIAGVVRGRPASLSESAGCP